jgi:hypothetical protein
MSGCRIGKISPKAGGIIHQLPVVERDDVQKAIVKMAVDTAALYKPGELNGCVVFAWAGDGSTATVFKIVEDTSVGSAQLPSFLADALRCRMIESGEWGV